MVLYSVLQGRTFWQQSSYCVCIIKYMNENSVQPKGFGKTLCSDLPGQDVFHRVNSSRLPVQQITCISTAAKLKVSISDDV